MTLRLFVQMSSPSSSFPKGGRGNEGRYLPKEYGVLFLIVARLSILEAQGEQKVFDEDVLLLQGKG